MSEPFKIDQKTRDAMICAAFDRNPDTGSIAIMFGLSKGYVNTIVRDQGLRPCANPNHAPSGAPVLAKTIRKTITPENQDFLKAVFAMHARRGTMPPHFTPTDFYKRLTEYKIRVPADLQGIAL